jgi:hypothetical protein
VSKITNFTGDKPVKFGNSRSVGISKCRKPTVFIKNPTFLPSL